MTLLMVPWLLVFHVDGGESGGLSEGGSGG